MCDTFDILLRRTTNKICGRLQIDGEAALSIVSYICMIIIYHHNSISLEINISRVKEERHWKAGQLVTLMVSEIG